MTQGHLAARLGVTHAALSRWLHGFATPRPRRIQAIKKLYTEMIGYPSISAARLSEVVRQADRLKRGGLWETIGRNQPLQDELLVEHTYNSTSIEGTTFSKRETEVVIFSKAIIPDKSLTEHLEVTNHAVVLRQIFQRERPGPITEVFIKTLHRDLMQGVREDAGRYSRHQRAIRGLDIALTHPKDIQEEMRTLIRSWNGRSAHTSIRDIADFHARFELIHPFGDGNGRVGRLLMTLQCLQWGYPPAVIENARKAEYFEVLEYAQRKADGPFVLFLMEEMQRTNQLIRKHLPSAP